VGISYSAGIGPVSVAVADFNRDGIPDLAVANWGGVNQGLQGTITILLGNSDGTFQAAVSYPTGLNSISVALGDFNGDGIPDLAVANAGSNNVSVLLGRGDGTFQAAVNYAVAHNPLCVAIGDFNGDGIPDLAVATAGAPTPGTPGTVGILLGNGDGTFQAARNYAAGTTTVFLAVGDFNRDGILDLVVINAGDATGQGGNAAILLGKGDGTFHAAGSYAAGRYPFSVAVADLNGDGIPDLVVANSLSNDVSVLLGEGDGTFRAAPAHRVGPYGVNTSPALVIAARDFNGDGIVDLAVAFGGGVRLLLGNGDGTFQTSARSYLAGTSPWAVAVGDFNGDGFPDLAVTNGLNNGVTILFKDGKSAP
jgi:hypothetical protein